MTVQELKDRLQELTDRGGNDVEVRIKSQAAAGDDYAPKYISIRYNLSEQKEELVID